MSYLRQKINDDHPPMSRTLKLLYASELPLQSLINAQALFLNKNCDFLVYLEIKCIPMNAINVILREAANVKAETIFGIHP